MLYRFRYVAGAGFALGADHGRTFGNTPKRFRQIATTAHKRYFERPFVDMVLISAGVSTSDSSMKSTSSASNIWPPRNARCGTWPSPVP